MYSNIVKEFDKISEIYPNVKYIESEDPDLTDDMIYLTDKLHIQVGLGNSYYSLIRQVGIIFHFLACSEDFNEIVFRAIAEAQPNGVAGMN